MRAARSPALLACLAALAAASPAPAGAQTAEPSVTVYSSLPLSGELREQALAIARGARLALDEAGGRAGAFSVRYVSLDDATAQFGSWIPEAEARNAERAAGDPSAVAYIGAYNSGASAVSLPITNEAGLLQLSPSNTYIGLTRGGLGTYRGDPARYYPTGERTYARLAPNDAVQGEALAALMRESGCRRAYFVHDGEAYGRGVALHARRSARARGLSVRGTRVARPHARDYRSLARRVRRTRARCVTYGGITANNAVQLFRDLVRGVPGVRLFGPDGLLERGFADPRRGGVPARVARRVRLTTNILGAAAYPPAGQRVLADYAARYGDPAPDVHALYGYESMALVLDAIRAAGDDRAGVIRAVFATRDRAGVVGTYSIDANGDTTLRDFGVYRIRRGRLVFERTVLA